MKTEKLEIRTPGNRWFLTNVINKDHVIHEAEEGRLYTVPLLDADSGIKILAECIKEAVDNNRNCPVLVTGDPGIGKSTVIGSTALEINPDYSPDDVAFTIDEFDKMYLRNSTEPDVPGRYRQNDADEAAHSLYGPEYLEEEQRVIAKNLIISRILKQIVYFATPKWKLLNPHVRNLVSVWVHVSEPEFYHQGYAVVKFPPPALQNEYMSQKFWVAQFAFVFRRLSGPWWDAYEKRKIEFVLKAMSEKQVKDPLKEVAKRLHEAGMGEVQIGKVLDKHQSTISRYISQNTT